MQTVQFNPTGNYIAAAYFCVIPIIIFVIGTLTRRKFRDSNSLSLIKRYLYFLILLLLIYYAIIYKWLFHNQFYWITLANNGTWKIEYPVPARSKTITVGDISSIRAVTGDIWTYKMMRISISTKGGDEYISSQIPISKKDYYLELLNEQMTVR